ncbi:MAG TPA: M1 family metallopeptidase [Micromonosporaceae bacterium]
MIGRVGWARSGAVAALVSVLALPACTAAPHRPGAGAGTPSPGAPVAAGSFAPGSDGLADPYYPTSGNGGYDVAHYGLDLRYDPGTDRLTGTATITAVATMDLSRFNVDLRELTVSRVTVDGAVAAATGRGDELVITPATGLVRGRQFVTVIAYGGVPQPYREDGLGEVGFLHTSDGAVAIGEPDVAASWFPVNDHPSDKASYTITIAAPDGLSALANGQLEGRRSVGGWTSWTWSQAQPMAPYLATVVIGRYRLVESTHDGKPVVLAVHASLPTEVDGQLARTPKVLDWLAELFGPYPFDAIGGVVINDQRVRFALENQTLPVYGSLFFAGGKDGTWVIVHELAHQWYGNSVSVRDWRQIWLNEGFATYAEWLWSERHGGQTAQQTFDDYYRQSSLPMWQVPPGNPGKPDLFDESVYTRGAMTLHALRMTVGDATFFRILKAWAAAKKYGNATTEDFIAFAERESGRQLDNLFDGWLFQQQRPPRP